MVAHVQDIGPGDQQGQQQTESHLLSALPRDPEQGIQQYEAKGGPKDNIPKQQHHQDTGLGGNDGEPGDDNQRDTEDGRRALAPRKFKKTGQLWPTTTNGLVMNKTHGSTPNSRGAATARTPFAVSINNTKSPAHAPVRL